jgi:hypothetical protein
MVLADTNILSRVEARATLANDNAARLHCFTTKPLYAEAFAFGIASVTGTTTSFLVCHCLNPPLRRNSSDFYLGEPLAVTSFLPKVLAAIEFNDLDLLVTTMVDHLSGDFTTGNNRRADLDIVTTANHQYLVEFDGITSGGFNFFQFEGLALYHAVLLATAFDYCVHNVLRSVSLLAFEKTLVNQGGRVRH